MNSVPPETDTPVSAPAPQAARLKIALVGRNISAAIDLLQLRQEAPDHELFWFQTAKDSRSASLAQGWTFLSSGLDKSLRPASGVIEAGDAPLFLEGHRRVPLAQIASGEIARKKAGVASRYPKPVIRKILSLGVWGDLSPDLWTRHGDRHLPSTDWPTDQPESAKFFSTFADSVIAHRSATLSHLLQVARDRGVKVEQENKWVLGLQTGRRYEPNQLVLNAPNPSQQVDRVLWYSQIDELNQENAGRGAKLAKQDNPIFGSWKSSGAWVEMRTVTALPYFSLWLDAKREAYFLRTGLHSSNLIKRVFALPQRLFGDSLEAPPAGMQSPVWLQIEDLELAPQAWVPEFLRPAADGAESSRKDSFLWELCPLLRFATPDFHEIVRIDEASVFEKPQGNPRNLGHGVFNVSPAKIPASKEFLKQMLTRFKSAQS